MKSNDGAITFSVGELARRFDLEAHVLRHWEDVGLLLPERDRAGRRVYGEGDAYRVATILASKASGMSLEEVRGLLDASTEGRREALQAHLLELDRRQREVERSRLLTLHALQCDAHDITTCSTFRAHVADIVDGTTRGLPLAVGHDQPTRRGARRGSS